MNNYVVLVTVEEAYGDEYRVGYDKHWIWIETDKDAIALDINEAEKVMNALKEILAIKGDSDDSISKTT